METTTVYHLESPLPRWAVEAAFGMMVLAAVLTISPVSQYMYAHCAWLKALINTIGDVVIYTALCLAMRRLPHPLKGWWITLLVLVVAGCTTSLLRSVEAWRDTMEIGDVLIAGLTPLVYIPLGALLLAYYRGALAQAGVWMMIRSIVCNLLPIVWVLMGVNDDFIVLDILYVAINILYAWSLRRVLVR